MALKIRLRQQGRNNHRTFRIVVADIRSPRDGKYIEMLGWYKPRQPENNITVDEERTNYWIGQGAELSECVKLLIGKVNPGIIKDLREKAAAKKLKSVEKRKKKA
jgi:small subunit ribosomal protein S16